MTTIQTVNLLTLPIKGICLIEASAGTGKTHTLITLYLQLLLGLGNKADYLKPLKVEEILVVTFTDAATEDLRRRIRDNIHRLRLACMHKLKNVPLLEQIDNYQIAASHLLIAEQNIDRAAIYTIHGFCYRMFNQFTLEFGVLFRHTVLENETFLQQQISTDFWRRHCYPLPTEVAQAVMQYWDGPEKLLLEVLPYLRGEAPLLKHENDTNESIVQCYARIIKNIDNLKKMWFTAMTEIHWIIKCHKLNRRVYSVKNISFWLEKIDQWSKQSTTDCKIPKELERFKRSVLEGNTFSGEPPQHSIFESIEVFYQKKYSLRKLILSLAIKEMRQLIESEKKRRAEIGFDDLLNHFDRALVDNDQKSLATLIRSRYPVAMIDEFQDTDPRQYRIFNRLYGNQSNYGLLLIGDPKQAIYAFRGADIFTYIHARRTIDTHYTLNINWRSTPGMINAVNKLFQLLSSPFIFNDIPFSPVVSAERNAKLRLIVQKKSPPAMHIWLQSGTTIGFTEYKKFMAQQCAATIGNWLSLSQTGEAWLEGHLGRQSLQASDIIVLVRNGNEASIIRDALKKLMIPAVYFSERNSVFNTSEAKELLYILQGVLTPDQDNVLRCALSTRLLGFNAVDIDHMNRNEKYWTKNVKQFIDYRQYWKKHGIFSMLRKIIKDYQILKKLLSTSEGKRSLINILHLGELMQAASIQRKNEYSLLNWLMSHIQFPDPEIENQQLRLESDRDIVRIISIHKSKGLEFPVVFFPFAACFRLQKRALFHDRTSYQMWLDLDATYDSMQLAEEERLAEDLRLLYVAITRSIYHCSLGIAPLFYGNHKRTGSSDLHLSALGYLIQQGQEGNANFLRSCISALTVCSDGDITFSENIISFTQKLKPKKILQQPLCTRDRPVKKNELWRIINDTHFRQHSAEVAINTQFQPKIIKIKKNKQFKIKKVMTSHTFPHSVLSEMFFHSLFETIDFTKPLDTQWLQHHLIKYGIDTIWISVITNWIKNIITIPLDGNALSLSHLCNKNIKRKLQFYLPIEAELKINDLDQICKCHDSLSKRCPPLNFVQLKGMLQGSIDLVFNWKDYYYLLDFKSNWLGKDSTAYTQLKMEQAIIIHRYDLQYQLYTLALNRFLRHRLIDYHYQRHFGGVFYLFLRGINKAYPRYGIYYCRPKEALINEIDSLFTGIPNMVVNTI